MRDAAQMLRFVADCMYTVIMSCMSAQVQAELNAEKTGKAQAPINLTMHRPGEVAPRPGPPIPTNFRQKRFRVRLSYSAPAPAHRAWCG